MIGFQKENGAKNVVCVSHGRCPLEDVAPQVEHTGRRRAIRESIHLKRLRRLSAGVHGETPTLSSVPCRLSPACLGKRPFFNEETRLRKERHAPGVVLRRGTALAVFIIPPGEATLRPPLRNKLPLP